MSLASRRDLHSGDFNRCVCKTVLKQFSASTMGYMAPANFIAESNATLRRGHRGAGGRGEGTPNFLCLFTSLITKEMPDHTMEYNQDPNVSAHRP